MIIETIVTSLTLDGLLRKIRNRRIKNNKPAIKKMMREDSPVFQTVGELREILNNFEDSTPISAGSYQYGNIQLRVLSGTGILHVGSQNCWEESDG